MFKIGVSRRFETCLHVVIFLITMFATNSTSNTTCNIQVYTDFLLKFDKVLNRAQNLQRLDQFCKTVEYIEAFNIRQSNRRMNTEYYFQLAVTDKADVFDNEIGDYFSVPIEQSQSGPQLFSSRVFLNNFIELSSRNTLPGDTEISVDWSDTLNPRGYSVIPPVQNQGVCGACWAFASAASVYASLKLSLYPTVEIRPFLKTSFDSIRAESANIAEENISRDVVSTDGLVHIPVLSAQQLIDCDRVFNTGCSGGSPWYALQYILSNGVVSASEYSFMQKQSTCRKVPDGGNVYFIRRFSMLQANNENAILRALNNGPVIVGICGTDLTFLYYASGIYNVDTCCTVQNHAMLLTGYGHDEESGLDYWIAQNSWGTAWGERGYMRILRQSGTVNAFNGGICGLALSPVVSSDGYIVGNNTIIGDSGGDSTVFDRYIISPFINIFSWMQVHWRETAFIIGFFCLALGIIFMVSAVYMDYLLRWHARLRASRRGYASIPDNVAINTAMFESINSRPNEQLQQQQNLRVKPKDTVVEIIV